MEQVNLLNIFNSIQTADNKEYGEYLMIAINQIKRFNLLPSVINKILLCKRSTIPSRISYFLKRIFEELSESDPLKYRNIFESIYLYINCKSVKVRCHSLRVILMVLNIKKLDLSPQELQGLTERLFDKEVSVRKEAIKICLIYQDCFINENLKIQLTLKDVIRFDQSSEVRKIGLLGLELNENTQNCIIERCVDSSIAVRKIFWLIILKKIKFVTLPLCQRIFIMKSAFVEREFNAKIFFMEAISSMGFDNFISMFHCDELSYEEAIKMYLQNSNQEFELKLLTPAYLHFMNIYYKFKEERDGRDSLNLIPLDDYLNILYNKCLNLENIISIDNEKNEIGINDIKVSSGLFKLLSYYDIFTDNSRKYILKIISHLLTKGNAKEIVEEAVILAKRICCSDLIPFLGSIIKKTRGSPLCLIICEFIMKYIPYSEIHDAIIKEIAILNLNESLNIFYWATINNRIQSLTKTYLEFLPNKKAIEGATDFVLMNIIGIECLEECLKNQAQKFSENVAIPISKLLLAKKLESNFYFKYILQLFYVTETEVILQYLSLFIYEYICLDSTPLIVVFSEVLEDITQNQKTFIDQCLFWINNSKTKNGSQKLFFEVSLYIYNNYETLKNKKFLFLTLDKIEILPCWDKLQTKRIIYLMSMITKKRPRENAQVLLTNLMQIDDGEPLESDEFKALKIMMNNY